MKFGLLMTSVWDRSTPPKQQFAEHRELLELADQLGFSSMFAGQHFLGSELRYYQPVPYLTYLSRFVPNFEVSTGLILLSLVNPVELAEQMATLDAVTDGKSVLCVGLGYSDHEFRAFGIPRETRVKRFEEGLNLIKMLWSGEETTFDGEFFKVDKAMPSVMPVRSPRPPIWIGGQGEKAIRRAARMADAWYTPPFPTHEGLATLRGIFLEERAKHGLSLDGAFPVRREVVIADGTQAAIKLAAERSQARYNVYLKWGLGQDLDKNNKGLGSQDDQDIVDRFILGTPEQVAEHLDNLRSDLGMTQFVFKPQWLGLPHAEAMRQLEEFGTQVIPLVQKAEASATAGALA